MGAPFRLVSEWMGHSTPSITLNIYGGKYRQDKIAIPEPRSRPTAGNVVRYAGLPSRRNGHETPRKGRRTIREGVFLPNNDNWPGTRLGCPVPILRGAHVRNAT